MNSKELFKESMRDLSTFYPSWKVNLQDKNTLVAWFDIFKSVSDKEFVDAVNEHILRERNNPTVASIMAYVKKESVLSLPLTRVEEHL